MKRWWAMLDHIVPLLNTFHVSQGKRRTKEDSVSQGIKKALVVDRFLKKCGPLTSAYTDSFFNSMNTTQELSALNILQTGPMIVRSYQKHPGLFKITPRMIRNWLMGGPVAR